MSAKFCTGRNKPNHALSGRVFSAFVDVVCNQPTSFFPFSEISSQPSPSELHPFFRSCAWPLSLTLFVTSLFPFSEISHSPAPLHVFSSEEDDHRDDRFGCDLTLVLRGSQKPARCGGEGLDLSAHRSVYRLGTLLPEPRHGPRWGRSHGAFEEEVRRRRNRSLRKAGQPSRRRRIESRHHVQSKSTSHQHVKAAPNHGALEGELRPGREAGHIHGLAVPEVLRRR